MVTKFRRYGQIADVLVRNGFGVFVQKLFPGIYRYRHCKSCPIETVSSTYERVRITLEELGPTFVKFGQIVSTRQELLPPALIEELKKLQDHTNPLPFEQIRPVIEAECPDHEECFTRIEETPIASASIAQVHRAWLKDGTPVALKVQRPGIEEIIEKDILILESLAARLEHSIPDSRVYNPTGMVKDFSTQIRKELDFVRDGRNADRLRTNMSGLEGIKIPRIYWENSSRRLLVMEFIEGCRVDHVEEIRAMGVDPALIADRGFNAYLTQIFEDGFFHGDPHPGNLLVTKDNELVFLDFGIVGIIRTERRFNFIRLLKAMVDHDSLLMIKALEGLGVTIQEQQRDQLRDEIYISMIESEGGQIGQLQFQGMAAGLTEILRRYRMQVPENLMLMLKVIIMVLDIGMKLDPTFDFNERARPFVSHLGSGESILNQLRYKAGHSLVEAADGLFDLPRNINKVLRTVSAGQIKLNMDDADIHKIQVIFDRTSDKILLGLVTAGIVVGSSLVLLASDVQLPNLVFWLAVIGYIIAIIVGFYAIYDAIFKKD
ncbi:MAG: AarF/UbiB family protein [Methanoregulaceae archaeon]|nr:AarF/UbiB family protein [Methanoregulaceae archaeon]